MSRWKQSLSDLSLGGLTSDEFTQFKSTFGGVPAAKISKLAKKKGFTLPSDTPAPPPPTYQGGGSTGSFNTAPPPGYSTRGESDRQHELDLIREQGVWNVNIQNAISYGNNLVAKTSAEAEIEINRATNETNRYLGDLGLRGVELQTGAQRYVAQLGLEGTKYSADAQKEISRGVNEANKYLGELGLQGTKLQTDAQRYVGELGLRGTELQANTQRYLGELGLEGTKYAADKESEWRKAIAGLEIKGRLDLQPIINAGLARVAEIEGEAARAVAETTGRYNVESVRVRGEADKEIGKMQLAGNMYGLIGAAFG